MTAGHETGGCADPQCDRHQLVISRKPGGPTIDDVVLAARIKGCICTPDVAMPNRRQRRDADRDGVPAQVRAAHERWCPLSTNPRLN